MEVPDEIAIHRTRAGRHQRSAGAWSWYAVDANGRELFGSPFTVGRVIAAEKLSICISDTDDVEIDVEEA